MSVISLNILFYAQKNSDKGQFCFGINSENLDQI